MEPKSVFVFDLDNTLAESKSSIDQEMAGLLKDLLSQTKVCVVSSAGLSQFHKQLLSQLPSDTNLGNLTISPTSGASMYIFDGANMQKIYEHTLTEEEVQNVSILLMQILQEVDFDFDTPSHGERLENRGSQISFALLGQDAPREEKTKADPDRSIRLGIISRLTPLLPDFSIRTGGASTIDIVKKGIDKAHAVDQLSDLLLTPVEDMLYVGDELFEGGNDETVKQTGIETKQISGPEETKELIRQYL